MSRPPASEAGRSTRAVLLLLVAGLAVISLLGWPVISRWIAPRTLTVFPSLARVGDPVEIAELTSAEYYGEVIVTLVELVDSVGAPDHMGRFYENLRTRTDPDTTALEYELARLVLDHEGALLGLARQRPWAAIESGYRRRQRFTSAIARGADVAYLARGRVQVAFDLDRLWAEAVCVQDAARVPLSACGLAGDTLDVVVPEGVRTLTGIINPFFDFEREVPGYVVLTERWPDAVDAYLPLVRQLARCKLERQAMARGVLDLADGSLARGLEGVLLAFGRDMAVRVETPRPLEPPLCRPPPTAEAGAGPAQ